MAKEKTYKVKITIVATIRSDEYDNPETMIAELSETSQYDIPSTDCVEVVDTEWRDSELINND